MHQSTSYRPVIAVDFDGTLAFGSWPDAYSAIPNTVLITWLNRMKYTRNARIILWTCRENYGGTRFPDKQYLNDAIRFCSRNGLLFDSVNCNDGEFPGDLELKKYGRKVLADLYIDDKSVPFNMNGHGWIRTIKWRLFLLFAGFRLKK